MESALLWDATTVLQFIFKCNLGSRPCQKDSRILREKNPLQSSVQCRLPMSD